MGLLVGTMNKPIAEKDIASVDSKGIPERLATKVMMIYLTLVDGSGCMPLIHYPTNTASASFMEEKVSN